MARHRTGSAPRVCREPQGLPVTKTDTRLQGCECSRECVTGLQPLRNARLHENYQPTALRNTRLGQLGRRLCGTAAHWAGCSTCRRAQ